MGSKPSKGKQLESSSESGEVLVTMPLFKKQSSDAKKKLQHMLYLVGHDSTSIFFC